MRIIPEQTVNRNFSVDGRPTVLIGGYGKAFRRRVRHRASAGLACVRQEADKRARGFRFMDIEHVASLTRGPHQTCRFKQAQMMRQRRRDDAKSFCDRASGKPLVASGYKYSKDIETSILRQRTKCSDDLSFIHEPVNSPRNKLNQFYLIKFF